jgi:hypothetical protein
MASVDRRSRQRHLVTRLDDGMSPIRSFGTITVRSAALILVPRPPSTAVSYPACYARWCACEPVFQRVLRRETTTGHESGREVTRHADVGRIHPRMVRCGPTPNANCWPGSPDLLLEQATYTCGRWTKTHASRCQRRTVAGVTITRGCLYPAQTWASAAQKRGSVRHRRGRGTARL